MSPVVPESLSMNRSRGTSSSDPWLDGRWPADALPRRDTADGAFNLRKESSHMHVLITARHLNLEAATKAYAEQKALKLVKYYDLIQEIEVTIETAEKNSFHVEMI